MAQVRMHAVDLRQFFECNHIVRAFSYLPPVRLEYFFFEPVVDECLWRKLLRFRDFRELAHQVSVDRDKILAALQRNVETLSRLPSNILRCRGPARERGLHFGKHNAVHAAYGEQFARRQYWMRDPTAVG